MTSFRVTFLPSEKTVEVESGVTLMEAAQSSGVEIDNLCGGNGVCGRCKVKVADGEVHADKHSISLLSKEEIKEGYVLACQTKVDQPVSIVVPDQPAAEECQILLDGVPVDYSVPEKVCVHKLSADPLNLFEPLVSKVTLKLKAPTLEENTNDLERVLRELRRKTGQEHFDVPLGCLQGLASKLRDHDWKVTVTLAKNGDIHRILQVEPGDTTERNYGLAVDVGTTTVVAQLVDLRSGKVLGVSGSHNLQARYGEDVISRMIYACGRQGGLDPLHRAVIENVNSLIRTLTEDKGIDANDITALVAAGNTTMSHLFLSLIPCSIRLDPYVPTATVYPQVSAKEIGIGIHPRGIVETLAGVASYVGGDIVAGILACGIADKPEIQVLIDVGTNGEIAIGNNEWLVCCSASAGPAFEGGGIKHGMRATRGAIEKVSLSNGDVRYQTIGQGKPRGICGSGLIDCLFEFARSHVIDSEGSYLMDEGNSRMIRRDGETQFILAYPEETETGKEIVVTQSDINHLIRSKGAVFAAIKSLVDYVGLAFEDITTFFVAGGFGSFLDIGKAISIGLLPDIDQKRISFVGNSSLMGARMCLLSTHNLERSVRIAKGTTNIELSRYQPFMDEYVAAMFLPHTDRRLFPSVTY